MLNEKIKFLIKEVSDINNSIEDKGKYICPEYSKIEIKKPFIKEHNFYDLGISSDQRDEYYQRLSWLVKEGGMDDLAYYLPYHFYPEEWGIYIPIESIGYIAAKYLGGSTHENLNTAYKVLLHHENYHYLNENLVSKWELRLNSACYKYNSYQPYNRNEECLANAHMLKKIRNIDEGSIEKIKDFCSKQPAGYRNFDEAKKPSEQKEIQLNLLQQYIGLSVLKINPRINDWSTKLDLDFYPSSDKDSLAKACRVFLLRNNQIGKSFNQLEFITKIEHISESKKFQKNLKRYNLEMKWKKIRGQISESIMGKLRLRKFPKNSKNQFSINIDDNHRAHIRVSDGRWEAIAIGPHTKMGHG